MDAQQERRVAINESRFREANEQVGDSIDGFLGASPESYKIMCECAVSECEDMIEIPVQAYRTARADSTRFIVKPDHVIPATEQTVEKTDTYWLVDKIGEGAKVADEKA